MHDFAWAYSPMPSVEDLWSRMIAYPRRPTESHKALLVQSYACIPEPLVRLLHRSGLQLIVLADHHPDLTLPDGAVVHSTSGERFAAYYSGMWHHIVFRLQYFQPYVMLHELAHAIEVVLNDEWNCVRDLSTMLHGTHRHTRLGSVTDYAETNPKEYFAESFTFGSMPARRQTLARLDPQMSRFVDALLRPSSDPPALWASRLLDHVRAEGALRALHRRPGQATLEAAYRKNGSRRTDVALLEGFFLRGLQIRAGMSHGMG